MRDAHSAALSLRAGELFASAGLHAFAALDFITSRDLLGRAAVLLPESDPRRLDLLPNLGVALTETGRPGETELLLADAAGQSRAAGSERDALRATIQLLSNRVYRSPTDREIDAAVSEAERAVDTLDAMADDVGVAEAAIALEYLEFLRGHMARSHEWAFRALRHGLAAGRLRESTQAAADFVGHRDVRAAPVQPVRRNRREPLVLLRRADLGKRRSRPDDDRRHSRRGTRPGSASTSDAGARSSSVTDSAGSGRPTRS